MEQNDFPIDNRTVASSAAAAPKPRKPRTRKRVQEEAAALSSSGGGDSSPVQPATKEFKLQEDGSLLEIQNNEALEQAPPLKKAKRSSSSSRPSYAAKTAVETKGAAAGPAALAVHVRTYSSQYGKRLMNQMEASQATQITIAELDELVKEGGENLRMSYFLPLMHWMRKTSLIIDAVAVLDKPKAMISEAEVFTKAALEADHGEPEEVVQTLRNRFDHLWWKIPVYDYEMVREMTSGGNKVRAVLVGVAIQSFPDKVTNETVECLSPKFRYYPVSSANNSGLHYEIAFCTTKAPIQPARGVAGQKRKSTVPKKKVSTVPEVNQQPHGEIGESLREGPFEPSGEQSPPSVSLHERVLAQSFDEKDCPIHAE
jgi:hypothetical protein